MPSGACTIRRDGVRGAVWYIKYIDGAGRQVKERLGRETDGWTKRKAERELRHRLADVEREGLRKADETTFAVFAERWQSEYLPSRGLKRSTSIAYDVDLRVHLIPWFGEVPLDELEHSPELIDRYVSAKRRTHSPKTVANTLGTLRRVLATAVRWRLIRSNPALLVERPRLDQPEMQVLTEAEIAALVAAYRELENGADESERRWWCLVRRLVVVALGTGLRRGELLGLTWADVALLDRRLTVRRAIVRGQVETPKSRSSRRTLELGPVTSAALEEQLAETPYKADSELVFGHPLLGTPLDPSKIARDFMRPALRQAGVIKPFRPWHDLRHTALTHEAAAGNPAVYVQMRAGHSQGSMTERYVHAAQVLFPGAAERGEARTFSAMSGTKSGTK